jgi:uncharacterized membrane protein
MLYSLADLVIFFFIYAFLGWLWETFYCSLLEKHFVYRGFLMGPYCPVYGFAVTTILVLTEPFQDRLIYLFISGFLITTLFEYFAAWLLETIFHLKLWDYSNLKGNIKGRVAPAISLFWGVGVLFLVKIVQPYLMSFSLPHKKIVALALFLVMMIDFMWTIKETFALRQFALAFENQVGVELEKIRQTIQSNSDTVEKQAELFNQKFDDFKQHIEEFIKENNLKTIRLNQRRLLKNYQKFKLEDAPILTDFRKQLVKLKKKMQD